MNLSPNLSETKVLVRQIKTKLTLEEAEMNPIHIKTLLTT